LADAADERLPASVGPPSQIGCTAEDVLEAFAEELSSNAQLRAFAAGLVGE
jgi:hypothetical protein